MMVRYYIVVSGRVQGVGFRYYVQSNAIKYSLTGFVRNMDNGMVEMEVQGDENKIQEFLSIIRKGNMFIRVDDLSSKEINTIDADTKFKVIY